jgi:N-glycosylase/DNA lyase
VEVPATFDLDRTVRGHGWYDLAPWRYDAEGKVLGRPLHLLRPAEGRAAREAQVVWAEVTESGWPGKPSRPRSTGGALAFRILAEGRLSAAVGRAAREAMRVCLRLDEDLEPFYRLAAELQARPPRRVPRLPSLAWAGEKGAGRLLCSPTVFEDAVKTLATTNCSWALTRVVVANLVEQLGAPGPNGARAFPTPEAMAERPERFYRDVIRAGYRAPFFVSLARAVAEGRLALEAWRASPLSTDALGQEIRALDGFGPYATEHLLKLLGRYDHLALDSWSRAKVARLRGKRKPPADATLRCWYAPYGRYAGLAFWLEVTADWHGDAPTWPP